MLHELLTTEFDKIKPLLTGERVNMEIKAIAAGNSSGLVFVDDKVNPQTALVFSHGQGGFYFTGLVNNPRFETGLEETIANLRMRLAELDVGYFEYSATSPQWEEYLEKLFAHQEYDQSTQLVYMFPELSKSQLPAPQQQEGFQVLEITRELLSSQDINTAYVKKNISDWWESLDIFLCLGAGYCVVCEGKTVALCFTSFVENKQNWELGVYTEGKHRKRGFAKEAAIRLLEMCQQQDIKPYWDCMEENIPSRRLAESLGFSPAFRYQVYEFKLD